ncbi:LOW QUALITY PROTEIN: natural cytotoxicity triggering receptor 2 [Suricata suricatta]|uniref:LOW QUALITY PROTEIN: natural cytotoxicity triggering receptor 2 n=1 Tax=Suricata suricatta TaxID=37032 RepID=UPI001155E829|nr:LOW QUALITY PROTEIN: natural cytotoxicity triggering receptor 2 [Suricata suricatta]
MFPAASTRGKGQMVQRALLPPLLLLPLLMSGEEEGESMGRRGEGGTGLLEEPVLVWPSPARSSETSFPGSGAVSEVQQLHRVAGPMLSVRCQYPPKGQPYERKSWCKELSAFKCTSLVTSSGPFKLAQASQFSIWDNSSTGFFIITMTGLKEEDSGHYWCRIYHASSNSVSKSMRFYLTVAPASASTQAPRASSAITALSHLQPLVLWSPCSVDSFWSRAWCYWPCLSGE